MSNDVLIAILGAGGFASIVTAIVVAVSNRRKLGADATKIITDAASGVVERLEAEIARKQTERDKVEAEHAREVTELRDELERLKQSWASERESWRRVNQLHVAFDVLAMAKLQEAGIDLGMEPPPLLPPVRADLS